MAATNSLLHAWQQVVSRRANDAAVFDTRGAVLRTFGNIEAEAADFAAGLLSDFSPGDVIAVQLGNHSCWPAALVACWRRGLVALPLERTISPNEREVALGVCCAAGLLTDDGEGVALARVNQEPVNWGEHVPVLLKLTSGTTAAPRAIRFRSEQLLADCTQICETMGITTADVNFGVIPVSHSYGFSNLLTPLLARGVPLVMSRDRMPRAVLDGLSSSRATVFPGMPVFYQAFCELNDNPPIEQLRLCVSAGAPLPLAVALRFREKFGLAIHSFYGASECGGICYDREARLEEQGFVGTPMAGVDVQLLDSGQICVRTAAAGDGYFPQPDEQRLANGCFTPDDLLLHNGAGFRIIGRVSDVINVAGKKVNPAEVEAVLLAFGGVREAVAFARTSERRNEEVAACVVTDPAVSETELLDFCRERLSSWQVPKRLFVLDQLPVNERGKISRRLLAERFAG
jgi:long-chain acyl-CoA synthetase